MGRVVTARRGNLDERRKQGSSTRVDGLGWVWVGGSPAATTGEAFAPVLCRLCCGGGGESPSGLPPRTQRIRRTGWQALVRGRWRPAEATHTRSAVSQPLKIDLRSNPSQMAICGQCGILSSHHQNRLCDARVISMGHCVKPTKHSARNPKHSACLTAPSIAACMPSMTRKSAHARCQQQRST